MAHVRARCACPGGARVALSPPAPSQEGYLVTAAILDGKALARQIQAELAEQIADFIENNGVVPCLAAVLVGENPASEVYVRNKREA
ncbi:MAG TPA: tetrahydrofolate dehydrogenase/cyclohydrolase catalytic domain-containing protein, partial [Pirellulales bacterium]|nr:tetrahydrofolate dehydrogenase/cyclohydrolase catalytic domain-containing protein [Pirellulales bacterium]